MTSLRRKLSHLLTPVSLGLLVMAPATPLLAAPTVFQTVPPAVLLAVLRAQAGAGPAPTAPGPGGAGASDPTVSAENEAAGRRHYKRGGELYKQGRFLDAAKEFEAGFKAAPRPLFLLNIGHSYRKAREWKRSRTAYEEYLQADPSTQIRADVEDLMKSIDDAIGASASSGAAPSPSSVGPAPASLPSSAAPTPIVLPRPVLIDVDRGPEPSSGSRPLLRNPWFWGAVGAVVVAGVAGTVYGLSRPPACTALLCLRETD